MGKKIRSILLFLLVAVLCAGLTLYLGQGISGMVIYNLVFLMLIIIIYVVAMVGGMWRMNTLESSLRKAGEDLAEYFDNPDRQNERLASKLDSIFDDEYLSSKMKNFLLGMRRSKEGIVDLEEYLNEDELDNHIHKRILEMVPDILTSLGILGTFLGLVWGLKGFDASFANMSGSVSTLMDGIKIAFLTSIYGVSMSVVYTYSIKSDYSAMIAELQGFLARFHGYVMPTAENKSRNLLVATQKQQNEVLKEMSISLTENMASTLHEIISPAFEDMNKTLRDLSRAIQTQQKESLQAMVDSFVKEMHDAFGVEFKGVKESMDQIMEIQKRNIISMQQTYRTLSNDMERAGIEMTKGMQDVLENMSAIQNKQLQEAENILKETRGLQESSKKEYMDLTGYMRESEKQAESFWEECNERMQKYVDISADATGKHAAISEVSGKLLYANKEVMDNCVAKLEELSEYQQMNYQLMGQMVSLLSGMSVVGNKRNTYLVGGDLTAAIARDTEWKRALERMEVIMEQQAEAQSRFMEEMRELTEKQTKKRGFFR